MSVSNKELLAVKVSLTLGMAAVNETLLVLETWLIGNRNHSEYVNFNAKYTALMGKFALLVAKREAVEATGNNISFPEPDRVKRILDLSEEVQALVDAATTAEQIIKLVNSTLKMADEVRDVTATA